MNDLEEFIKQGILRVEAGNDRSNHIKRHKPSLGTYEPAYCVDCLKLWRICGQEECIPKNWRNDMEEIKLRPSQIYALHRLFDTYQSCLNDVHEYSLVQLDYNLRASVKELYDSFQSDLGLGA